MPIAWALPVAAAGAAALAAALLGAARAIEAVAGPCDDCSDNSVCEGTHTGSGGGNGTSGDTVSTSGGSDSHGGPATPHCAEPAKAVLGSARSSMEQHAG